MRYFIIFWGFLSINFILAQEQINLYDCYKLAIDNYPQKQQIPLQKSISDIKIRNYYNGYLPEIQLFGQAQYQSDATKIAVSLPAFPDLKLKLPEMSLDQYKIGVNINQVIWDGGIIANQEDLEISQILIDSTKIEVDLYNIKQRVNDLFFGILIINKKIDICNNAINDLNNKYNNINSKVNNGVILQSNADILRAEIIKLEQTYLELKSNKTSFFDMLSILLNKKIDTNSVLVVPDSFSNVNKNNKSRIEYSLFDYSKQGLQETKSLIQSKYYPKFSAFFQGVYGKPGLNMFDQEFKAYYIVGLKASWNIWNWYQSNREEEIISLQQKLIDIQENTFTINLDVYLTKYLNDIDKLSILINKDNEIISLKESIVKQYSSQLENGVITSSEFLTEFNSKILSNINLEIHKLELIQTKINYLTQLGLQ